jgi:hypothetical protein
LFALVVEGSKNTDGEHRDGSGPKETDSKPAPAKSIRHQGSCENAQKLTNSEHNRYGEGIVISSQLD